MQSLIKKIITLSLICAIGWLGFSKYLESKLKEKVDWLIAMSGQVVNIQYDDLLIHYNGVISASNVRFNPISTNAISSGSVNKLSVTFPDILYMIKLLTGNIKGTPDDLVIRMEGISSAINYDGLSDVSEFLESFNNKLKEHIKPVCGDHFFMTADDYKAMKFMETPINAEIKFKLDEQAKELSSSVALELPGIGSIGVESTSGSIRALTPIAMEGVPSIKKVTILMKNDGYFNKAVKYCAQKAQLSTDDYIKQEVSQEDLYYELMWGISPNTAIKTAYHDFLKNPDAIELKVTSISEQDMKILPMISPNEWKNYIALQLEVNGKKVEPFELKPEKQIEIFTNMIAEAQMGEKAPNKPKPLKNTTVNKDFDQAVKSNASSIQPPPPEPERRYITPSFKAVATTALSKYIDSRIKVRLHNGRIYEGVIKKAGELSITLQPRISGGFATITLDLDRIESAKVWK